MNLAFKASQLKNKEITKIFQDRIKTNKNSVDQERRFVVLSCIFFLLLLGFNF